MTSKSLALSYLQKSDLIICYYHISGTPKSLHILRARLSSISLCLGTVECLFKKGLIHHMNDCRLPVIVCIR